MSQAALAVLPLWAEFLYRKSSHPNAPLEEPFTMNHQPQLFLVAALSLGVLACEPKKAPETPPKAPETKTPEAKTPEAKRAPEAKKAPDAKVPEAKKAPDAKIPGAPNQAPQTAELDGEYLHNHKIVTDLDSGEESDVSDCFSLSTFEDGSIEFGLELNFTLDHTCTMRGEASPKGKNTWVYKGSEKEDKGCVLELVFAPGHVDIKDESGACREHWCGARGGLDSHRFEFKNKQKNNKKCGQ